MTKPEFDKLYSEKLAQGLNFPLNNLIETINNPSNYKKTSDILGHILAHQMASEVCGDGHGHSVYVGNLKINSQSYNPKVTLEVQFDIYDNSAI